MEQYISTILSVLISVYLPKFIELDQTATVTCSLAIAQLLTIMLKYMPKLSILTYIWNVKEVIIDEQNISYNKIIDYIYDEHINKIRSCKYESVYGKSKMITDKLKKSYVTEKFSNKKMYISLQSQKDKKPLLHIRSNAPITLIQKYIDHIITKQNKKGFNKTAVYRLIVTDKKKRLIEWKSNVTSISKNISNTIVSADVDKNFYQDLLQFMNNEKSYLKKGFPYKRGYVLHGEPGCGKTSLIKAVANEYDIPIFILDISIFKKNEELIEAVQSISDCLAYREKHLLVLEDVDRSKVFNKWEWRRPITEDCLLNVLDGVDEIYGRLTIMTTNNLNVLKGMPALVRPGRIDKVVHVGYCEKEQIEKMIKFYYDIDKLDIKLSDDIIITPAILIKLYLMYQNYEDMVKLLNKHKNMTNINVDSECAIEATHKEKDEDDYAYFMEKIKKKEKQLAKYKAEIDIGELLLDNMSKKERLIYDKKKLMHDILEINIEEDKQKFELRKKKDKI